MFTILGKRADSKFSKAYLLRKGHWFPSGSQLEKWSLQARGVIVHAMRSCRPNSARDQKACLNFPIALDERLIEAKDLLQYRPLWVFQVEETTILASPTDEAVTLTQFLEEGSPPDERAVLDITHARENVKKISVVKKTLGGVLEEEEVPLEHLSLWQIVQIISHHDCGLPSGIQLSFETSAMSCGLLELYGDINYRNGVQVPKRLELCENMIQSRIGSAFQVSEFPQVSFWFSQRNPIYPTAFELNRSLVTELLTPPAQPDRQPGKSS